jgi:AraC-like DNA-binding protein
MKTIEKNIHREITPLKNHDCFLVFDRKRKEFNYPIHFHPEYELNFILGAEGGRRIVGDHIDSIGYRELVLIGPNTSHGWENFKNLGEREFHEVTIQFKQDMFDSELLDKNIMHPIRALFQNSKRGILFSEDTIKRVEETILSMSQKQGFDGFLKLQSLLYDLAISRDQTFLAHLEFASTDDFQSNERIETIYHFLKENYQRKIKIDEVAELVHMSVISLGRLIRQSTGKSFIEFLIEIRLGSATRQLIETDRSITEICLQCGFNNISNFNRIFKKYRRCTPSEFRHNFRGVRTVY